MATGRENLFDAVLVKDLMNKVKGKSSLAVLSGQTPIPFNGLKEFIFSRRAWNYRNNGERSGNNTVGVFGIHESGV